MTTIKIGDRLVRVENARVPEVKARALQLRLKAERERREILSEGPKFRTNHLAGWLA